MDLCFKFILVIIFTTISKYWTQRIKQSFLGRTPSTVKSFNEFRKSKGKEWKAMVSKKQVDKEIEVHIMIGMMYYCVKEMRLKQKRGKRIALSVLNKAPYNVILEKAVGKFSAYHSDVFDTNEDYVLLLENGEEAQFILGSCPKEFLSLKRYKEDLGKDYARIILYLCSMNDFIINTHEDEEEEKDPIDESCTPKKESQNQLPKLKRSSLHMNQMKPRLESYKVSLMRKVKKILVFLHLIL